MPAPTPIKRSWFYILLSLAERDRHGSGIARDVDELSQGELRLWPVTLYGTLDELTDKGWIQALDDPRDRPPGESERKRYFRITRAGRRALELEAARLAALAGTAHRRLLGTGETR